MEQRVIEGSLSVIASLVALAAAAFVLRANPASTAHRRLANVLGFEAILNAFLGAFMLLEYPVWGWGPYNIHEGYSFVQIGFATTFAIVPWYYLLFLGSLHTRATARLAGRRAEIAMFAGVLAMIAAFVVPLAWLPPDRYSDGYQVYGAILGASIFLVVSIFGLAVSVSVSRDLPSEANNWNAYLLAFGARDGLYVAFILLDIVLVYVIGEYPFDPLTLPALVVFIYVPFLVNGIQKHRMLR